MPEHDSLRRFIFESLPVQGRYVHLDASWRAVLERQQYPAPVRALLGQAMAATALLSATLKYDGSITLQIRGNGPLHLLVVQCTSGLSLRGLARWHGDLPDTGLSSLVGAGNLVLTIEQSGNGERYQSIVPIEGDTLAVSLENYFLRSEQLPTRLWLSVDEGSAAGLLLQAMPDREREPDAWQHVTVLADTVSERELNMLPAQQLLHRLFNEDDVRLFDPSPVSFRCQCSRERIEATLRSLGVDEVQGIIREQGKVHVECEFCARQYDFDPVDVQALFASGAQLPQSDMRH
ncbi:MAG TPA: Hsp33 family molecular chaperone HslO [Gammaproteobacteria bacterium]|nr:Hsp33 family molecular chaperone HslO [Gammaproteobacteria bacterium]